MSVWTAWPPAPLGMTSGVDLGMSRHQTKDILLPFLLKYLYIYSLKLKDYLLTFDTIYGVVQTNRVQPRASGVDLGVTQHQIQKIILLHSS